MHKIVSVKPLAHSLYYSAASRKIPLLVLYCTRGDKINKNANQSQSTTVSYNNNIIIVQHIRALF